MDYFILKPDGEQTGTYSIEQIRDMLATGFIGSDTRYWHEGITEWRPIDRIEESLDLQPPVPTAQEVAAARPQKLPVASRLIKRPDPLRQKSHVSPGPSTKVEDQPSAPAVPAFLPSQNESPASPDIPREAGPARTQPTDAARPKGRRLLGWVLYMINVTLVALAIDYGGPAVHYVWDLLQTKVTLTASTYALVDRSKLKTFVDEMQNRSMIEGVQHQIELTTDPKSRAWLQAALERDSARHVQDVQQHYLQSSEAEFIDPGIYRVLDYFDDKGVSTGHHDKNLVWTAISYQGQTVYLFMAADSTQTARPPEK